MKPIDSGSGYSKKTIRKRLAISHQLSAFGQKNRNVSIMVNDLLNSVQRPKGRKKKGKKGVF
jgi:hypothetical protein